MKNNIEVEAILHLPMFHAVATEPYEARRYHMPVLCVGVLWLELPRSAFDERRRT
jgi:hypothetical protein